MNERTKAHPAPINHMHRSQRTFLSPQDALEIRSREPVSMIGVEVSYPGRGWRPDKRADEEAEEKQWSSLPPPSRRPPPPPNTSISSNPSAPQGAWAADSLEEGHRFGHHRRRFSDQDIKTRSARASLTVAQGHKSAVSYPVYLPDSHQTGYSPSPSSLVWGVPLKMEAPRLHARSTSAPSISTRSSFESRQPSPLSISSSIDWDSSVTSEDSSYFDRKHDLLGSNSPIPPTRYPGRRMITEPIVPQRPAQLQNTRMSNAPARTFGKQYTPRIRGEGFKKLPEEILLVILGELKKLHLDAGSLSCATCCMRDMVTLGLTCKKWWAAARIALYEDIQLVGTDSAFHMKKRFKVKYGTRLRLLRRTLRERPDLADHVKSLKVPAMPDFLKSKKEEEEYSDLVASVIMACPNLEKLPGNFSEYDHTFSRIVQALSSRKKLTEKVWIINPSPFQRQHRYQMSDGSDNFTSILAPGPLLPEQCIDFLTYHSNWSNLHTLVMHCAPGGTVDSLLFADIFYSLPCLENLHVSNFPAPSFNDETLLALPPLKSLRLENLPGITENGLSSFASYDRTCLLTSLSLISIPLLSIPVLARLFSHLTTLTHFTISQAPSPLLPADSEIWLYPYFASRTLQYLHWEFTNSDDEQATDILAKSIKFQGFPSLRTIRAPSDYHGTLQRLCLPRAKIELSSDKYRNMGAASRPIIPHSKSPPSPTRSSFSHGSSSSTSSNHSKSPSRSSFSASLERPSTSDEPIRSRGTSLASARRLAQQRIESAAQSETPQFHIIIWDEDEFIGRHPIGFMGDITSRIYYSLKPDIDGSDEAIMGMEALRDLSEETGFRDGCTGVWNLDLGSTGMKGKKGKGKEWWGHTERGRWKEVELGRLF